MPAPADALRTAVAAATNAGLDPDGAEVFRVRAAVLVSLPRADVIARVEPLSALAVSRAQVVAAATGARLGAPVCPLVRPDLQPIVLDDGVVTLWRRLHDTGQPADPRALGATLRQLHDTTRGALPPELPPLEPFTEALQCLDAAAAAFDAAGVDALKREVSALLARWPELVAEDPLGLAMVHGDPHVDNVVTTADGPVLVDLEMTSSGPASWDLAVLGAGVRYYHHDPAAFEGRDAEKIRHVLDSVVDPASPSPCPQLRNRALQTRAARFPLGRRGDGGAEGAGSVVMRESQNRPHTWLEPHLRSAP